MNHDHIRRTLLTNGITILSEENPNFFSVSIGLWFKGGVNQETIENNGISHFLEHMNFKGTPGRNYEQIASYLECRGGHINAFTSRENVCYYARILPEHVEEAMDILSDISLHSIYPEAEIEKEKLIVLEEIRDVLDNPSDYIGDLFYETLFKDHCLGYQILGNPDNINRFERHELRNYIQQNYTPNSLILSASGPFDHQKLIDLAAQYLESPTFNPKPLLPEPASTPYHPQIAFHQHQITQLHICIGLPIIPYHHPDKWPMIVLNTLLGGGMSSILFQEIREKLGIAYSISSFVDFYKTIGVWGIYWSTEKKNFKKSMDKIQDVLIHLNDRHLNEELLQSAKNQIKGSILMGQESITNRMSRLVKNELYYGRIIPIEEVILKIESIKLDEVIQTVNRYLKGQNLSLAVIGNMKDSSGLAPMQL